MFCFSDLFQVEKSYLDLLGGVEFDSQTGKIVGAKAVKMEFIGLMNTTKAKIEGASIHNALGEYVSDQKCIVNKNVLVHFNLNYFLK